jgi:hypothetical protein
MFNYELRFSKETGVGRPEKSPKVGKFLFAPNTGSTPAQKFIIMPPNSKEQNKNIRTQQGRSKIIYLQKDDADTATIQNV